MHNLQSPLIQQFMHQKVEVTERSNKLMIGGKEITVESTLVADNDPTIAALSVAAKAEGFHLRVLTPGMMSTCDYRTDRLNVCVAKAPDGSHYRIEGFDIG